MFYGGVRAAWSTEIMREILREYGAHRSMVLGIDIHTGLGRRGDVQLIFNGTSGDVPAALQKVFVQLQVTTIDRSAATVSHGLLAHAYRRLPAAAAECLTLEIGTVPIAVALEALRADNWLHLHGDPLGKGAEAIRHAMLEAFTPSEDSWRRAGIGHITSGVRRAMAVLQSKGNL